jgi:hypothetical protein
VNPPGSPQAVERELAALARSLPRFVREDDAGDLFQIGARGIRKMVERGELARGVAGTVTRVSILDRIARRQGANLDDLALVLEALEAAPPLQALPGGVGTLRSPTRSERSPT